MSKQLTQEKQNQIVELRQGGKTYRQISNATGADGPTIAKYLKKAGLTKRAEPFASSAAVVPPSPQASVGAAGASPVVSQVPASVIPSSAANLEEFQPPAPPIAKKTEANQICQCEHCGTQFRLDLGETVETVKCPRCGQ